MNEMVKFVLIVGSLVIPFTLYIILSLHAEDKRKNARTALISAILAEKEKARKRRQRDRVTELVHLADFMAELIGREETKSKSMSRYEWATNYPENTWDWLNKLLWIKGGGFTSTDGLRDGYKDYYMPSKLLKGLYYVETHAERRRVCYRCLRYRIDDD